MSDDMPVKIGPGRLVLVVGPSGAGKDTLIDLARAALCDDSNVVFARRIVTRRASEAENNIYVSPEEFAATRASGEFAVWWDAHDLQYALARSIDDDVRAGRSVVANVSRTVTATLRARYVDCIVVEITAPADVLAQRLAARHRSSDGAIDKRLGRSVTAHAADRTIVNIGDAAIHARELIDAIRS